MEGVGSQLNAFELIELIANQTNIHSKIYDKSLFQDISCFWFCFQNYIFRLKSSKSSGYITPPSINAIHLLKSETLGTDLIQLVSTY